MTPLGETVRFPAIGHWSNRMGSVSGSLVCTSGSVLSGLAFGFGLLSLLSARSWC